jgi:pyruvate/2-oxoglutarate dehydrogenase complex dihydrolipoamide acyltransferase (E2) component
MPTKITMPQLGESVNEGTVGRWLKNVGDTVKKDESLVEIITDKVTAELPSPVTGRLVAILVNEDETVRVGADIAEIEEPGGQGPAAEAPGATSGAFSGTSASASGATPADSAPLTSSSSAGATAIEASNSASNGASGTARSAVAEKVSPLARRLAQEYQVDVTAIRGSGEGGRVRKEDILAYAAQRSAQGTPTAPATAVQSPAPAPLTPALAVAALAGDEIITPSPARRAIAEHMVRSKHTSPHAITVFEVDMSNLARWLDRYRDAFKAREGYGISYQTFVVKAAVEALKEYPYLNASWTDDGKILLRKQINVGISVALDNNLIVPVIRNADTLNIAGLARAVADLVARARANKLVPADVQGSTFTVNNPGVFGTLMSMAIINQPNAAILTMDSVEKRPVVVDDAIAIRNMMYMSLSFDHRILDGLTAAQFLASIKRRLESWGPETEVY